MGPLFSAAAAAAFFALVVGVVFVVLGLFQPSRNAFALALGFGVCAFVSAGVALVVATLVVGIGQTLNSGVAVAAYLGSVCVAGLVGGGVGARQASRVLTSRSSGLPSASVELQR